MALHQATELAPQDAEPWYALGLAHRQHQRDAEALRAFARALSLNPSFYGALAQMADIYRTRGETGKAEAQYQQALAARPQDVTLTLHLADLYATNKKPQDAAATYHKAVALAPKDARPLLRLGDFYARTRQPEAALTAYKQAATLAPEAREPREKIADVLLSQNKLDDATRYASELLKSRDGQMTGRYLQARLALARGQTADAIVALEEVLKTTPTLAQAHHSLGVAHWRRQNTRLAIAAFTKAIEVSPTLVEPYLALAGLHLQARAFDQALDVAQKLFTVQPEHVQTHILQGQISLARGDPARALAALKTATQKAPQEPAGFYQLGLAYRSQQQEPDALQAFEQALALDPRLVDALTRITEIYTAQGQQDKALARVRSQIHAAPHDPRLYHLLGSLALAQNNEAEAEDALHKAVQLDENFLPAYLKLGRLYAGKTAPEQALAHYETLTATRPHLLPPYMLLAVYYEIRQNPQKAREYYQKVLQVDPKFALAANNLASHYADQGEHLDTALALASTAKEQLPNSPEVTGTLDWVQYKKGDYPKALHLLRESVEGRGNSAVLRYYLGMTYYKTGHKEFAKAELQQALQLSKDFPGAKEAQDTLALLQ